MTTTIRTRTEADLPACATALTQVHASDGYPVEGVDDPYSWLSPPTLIRAWVAELDRDIVGHVALSHPDNEDAVALWIAQSTTPEHEVVVLARLFVRAHARHQAIGTRLTRIATNHARDSSRRPVLDVMAKDHSAIRLYERLGWQRIGTTTHNVNNTHTTPAYCYVAPP